MMKIIQHRLEVGDSHQFYPDRAESPRAKHSDKLSNFPRSYLKTYSASTLELQEIRNIQLFLF